MGNIIQYLPNTLELEIINTYQNDFPLTRRPFATIAKGLNTTEDEVLRVIRKLSANKVISRVGPVFKPATIGVSTLAAMAIPAAQLLSVANYISKLSAVNHNYERSHHFNLWFVITSANQKKLDDLLVSIEEHCGYKVLNLPMIKDYHIDLGFRISC